MISGHWPVPGTLFCSYCRWRDNKRIDFSLPASPSVLSWLQENLIPEVEFLVLSWTDWPRDPTIHLWQYVRRV